MSWQHKGYTIQINEKGEFTSQLSDDGLEVKASTLEEVKKLIETEAGKKRRTLNIRVIGTLTNLNSWDSKKRDREGEIFRSMVTGVNRTTGKLTFKDVPDKYTLDHVLPDKPGAMTLLEAWVAAKKQFDHLDAVLKTHRMDINYSYGRIAVAEYDKKLDRVQEIADGFKLED